MTNTGNTAAKRGSDVILGTPFSRRDFVKSAVGSGVAFGLSNAADAAATGMYVSLNSTLTGGKVGWPEFGRLGAKIGYGGVDLSLQAAMKEGVDATRTLLSGLKLRAPYCSLPVTPNAR